MPQVPGWLAPVSDRVGRWLLGREIETRIHAFARACDDPVVLAAVRAAPRVVRSRDR